MLEIVQKIQTTNGGKVAMTPGSVVMEEPVAIINKYSGKYYCVVAYILQFKNNDFFFF